MIKKLAVFCGSKTGKNTIYKEAAIRLTSVLYKENIGIVYGGGRIGLMGIIADHMLKLGGEVIGVIPTLIKDMEVAHEGITELHVVDTMHERKALMAQKSDGFIALPGGIGTLEEIIEVFTWQQLGYHQKPCAFLNVNGYFDKFIHFMDHMVEENFLSESQRGSLIVETDAEALIERMGHRDFGS